MGNNNSDITIMIVGGTVVLLLLLFFIISFFHLFRNSQHKYKIDMIRAKEQFNREILNTQLEIKEQTLKNVSEEIHDNVGQVLSLVTLNLSSIDFKDEKSASEMVDRMSDLVKKAIADLRNLSKTMDSDLISKIGLPAIIRFNVNLLENAGFCTVSFRVEGKEYKLDDSREIILYRFAQEALNNIVRHSEATEVSIILHYGDNTLFFSISDNGKGFDPATISGGAGNNGAGLKNMRNRAALINASLIIESSLQKGTTIEMNVPYS
jgi:two-component system NarL family sensor kinase